MDDKPNMTMSIKDNARWVELVRMIDDWEDSYESCGYLARRIIVWWREQENS